MDQQFVLTSPPHFSLHILPPCPISAYLLSSLRLFSSPVTCCFTSFYIIFLHFSFPNRRSPLLTTISPLASPHPALPFLATPYCLSHFTTSPLQFISIHSTSPYDLFISPRLTSIHLTWVLASPLLTSLFLTSATHLSSVHRIIYPFILYFLILLGIHIPVSLGKGNLWSLEPKQCIDTVDQNVLEPIIALPKDKGRRYTS